MQQTTKYFVFYVTILGIISYFILHGIYGDRGLISYFQIKHQTEHSISELKYLHAKRLKIEKKVNLLSSDHLDSDLLDEQARSKFDLGKKTEKIFGD